MLWFPVAMRRQETNWRPTSTPWAPRRNLPAAPMPFSELRITWVTSALGDSMLPKLKVCESPVEAGPTNSVPETRRT